MDFMKKLIALFIAIVIICTALISCGDSNKASEKADNKDENKASDNVDNSDNESKEPTDQRIYPELPEITFDGYEFKFLVNDWYEHADIYVEEENAELVNDAVYKRNKIIEERYDIIISAKDEGNPSASISKFVRAGDCPYDVMIDAAANTKSVITQNMVVDLHTVPYLNFEKPYWDHTLTKEFSMGGKLFCNVSDMLVSDKEYTWAIFFNKQMVQDYDLESPYQLVKDGKWTLDKLREITRGVTSDLNGDGVYFVLDDLFGFSTEDYNMFLMIIGSGCRMVDKDENDLPVIAVNNQRFFSAYEKIMEIHNAPSTINVNKITGLPDKWYGGIIPAFCEGRVFMYMGGLDVVPYFRGMAQDFGILPPPKYDEAQEKYYTSMSDCSSSAIYIPTTNDNLERTGIILEALAAESRYTVLPAYYDITLKTKMSRDDESEEMLDILFANRIFDLGHIFNFGGIFNLVKSETDDFVSRYEAIEEKANAEIQKLIDELSLS